MIPVRFIKQGINVAHPYSSCASTFVYEHNHKSRRAYVSFRNELAMQKKSEPIQIKRTQSNLSQFLQAWS